MRANKPGINSPSGFGKIPRALCGARGRVDADVRKSSRPSCGKFLLIGQTEMQNRRRYAGVGQLVLAEHFHEVQQIELVEIEVGIDRIDALDDRQLGRLCLHQVTDVDQVPANTAADRSTDF